MDMITISREERNVLRREAIPHGVSAFEDLARMVRGEIKDPDGLEEMVAAEEIATTFGVIGWELDGDRDLYELPCSDQIRALVWSVWESARAAMEDEREGAEAVMGTCAGILERFKAAEPSHLLEVAAA